MNDQIVQVWKYLLENNVSYLTIGGFAVNIYGYGRNTGDVDIYIEDTSLNRESLRRALVQMGLGDFKNIATMQFIPGWTDIDININFRLDIMTSVKGLENKPFKELLDDATIVEINGVKVFFLDYNNLIISKKAANRPKDLLDIEELEKINKTE